MSISEVLLFIATNSRACVPCIEFKTHHRFPAQIIRLDSESAREQATNGSFFQITSVPTMVVIYNDGNTQMFVGSPKIIQWMSMIIKSEKEESTNNLAAYNPAGGNMYGPRPTPPRPPFQDDYREPAPVKRTVIEEYGEEDEYEEEEEPEFVKPVPKAPKKKPTPAVKPKKSKKKPPVRFEEPEEEEPEEEVEYFEPKVPKTKTKKQPKAASAPLKKQQPSQMNGLMEEARRMEQDRKSSLGYREEDLPKY